MQQQLEQLAMLLPHDLQDESTDPKDDGEQGDETGDDEGRETRHKSRGAIFKVDGHHENGSQDDEKSREQ